MTNEEIQAVADAMDARKKAARSDMVKKVMAFVTTHGTAVAIGAGAILLFRLI
jgi:hypothetical protein